MVHADHREELDYQEFNPDNNLKQFVECIWYINGQNRGVNSCAEPLVPGGRSEFIFTRSAVLWYGNDLKNKPERLASPFLLGQRDCVNYITCLDNYDSINVRLKYGCLPVFNNTPVNMFTNKVVPLSKLFGEAVSSLTAPLFEIRSFNDRAQLIGLWLEKNIIDLRKDWFELQAFLNEVAAYGDVNNSIIRKISDSYGWSEKKLERIFLKYIGFTPYQFYKLVRFRKLMEMIFGGYKNLTDLAHSNGFYDQSHLIRECYRYAGDKPTTFLKNPNNIIRFIYSRR